MRIIDKKEKVGERETIANLLALGLHEVPVTQIVELIDIKAPAEKIFGLLRDFIARNDVIARSASDAAIQAIHEGITELTNVLDNLKHFGDGVIGDLSIVRGLDYYTGTVYETRLLDVPEFTGSVCSGGRYDDLAGGYINKHLPGVGISIGFSRLFDVLRQTRPEKLGIGPKSPADILMTIPLECDPDAARAAARVLRKRYKVETYHTQRKVQDQLKYASKKGIPFVWFPYTEGHEIKDMTRGDQVKADPDTWVKPQ